MFAEMHSSGLDELTDSGILFTNYKVDRSASCTPDCILDNSSPKVYGALWGIKISNTIYRNPLNHPLQILCS